MIQVGDGLAHREKALLQVELAAEEHRHDVRGGDREARRGFELGKAGNVVGAQLFDAGGNAHKGQAVRRQDERAGGQLGDTVE